MVKREQEISPAPSEYGSSASSPASADVKPTAKRTKKTPSPSKTKTSPKKTPQPRAEGVISSEMKTEMMIAAMDMAHKGLPYDAFAAEYGVAASRLKDQFKKGRSNLRQKAIESAGGPSKEGK